jgi:hypothetical protein
VSSVMIRSASPSFCTRSTTPVSRYRLTKGFSHYGVTSPRGDTGGWR